ncbi:hypothetical protein TrVE_jg1810 [Triparma verrucosa]|uniref:Uncharacterized protein n=1 Tax=Triparma verrucosa TaxID=1606542 RepID=A0A9W7C5M1_9STRA|nr:hypothetical protein TrVE_jg1810 [Triparma verrucosa]
MLKLKALFACYTYVGMVAWCIWGIRGNGPMSPIASIVVYSSGAALFTLVFKWSIKIRAIIGHLPDKDLELFLVQTLFKVMAKMLEMRSKRAISTGELSQEIGVNSFV